jgi:hypothetical protein
MRVQKITNPLYVGEVAELIMKYYHRVKDGCGMYNGITYESLYTYITRVVQMGGDRAEFWVAYDEDKPVGWATWRMMDLPNVGTVFCDCLYNDTRNQKAIKGLYDEFINFGKRHRCPLYQYGAVNEKVAEYFKNVLDKLGVDAKDSGAKIYIGRERS